MGAATWGALFDPARYSRKNPAIGCGGWSSRYL